MPAVRGIYGHHPFTGEPGIWIWGDWGEKPVIGISESQLSSISLVGTDADKMLKLQATVEANLISLSEYRSALTPEGKASIGDNPPPYTRIEGDDLVEQPITITIEVVSLDPLVVVPIIGNGSKRLIRVG